MPFWVRRKPNFQVNPKIELQLPAKIYLNLLKSSKLSNPPKPSIPSHRFTLHWKRKEKEEIKETDCQRTGTEYQKTDKKGIRKIQRTERNKSKNKKTRRIEEPRDRKTGSESNNKNNRKILIKEANTSKIRISDNKRMIRKM